MTPDRTPSSSRDRRAPRPGWRRLVTPFLIAWAVIVYVGHYAQFLDLAGAVLSRLTR
jgi:hypothetical protein